MAGTALVFVALVGSAAPASAHAALSSTSPAGGSAGGAPDEVVLRFTEGVDVPAGGIRLFDAEAERVEVGRVRSVERNGVAVDLPDLDRGGYVVTWRVTSADSHPIHGAFTFRVGPAVDLSDDQALARKLLAADGGSSFVGGVSAAVSLASFAALVVLVGGFAILALTWPAGFAVGRARRILWSAWTVAVVATALGIPTQAAYSTGLDLLDGFSGGALADVLSTRFGTVWAARLGILVLAGATLWWSARRRGRALYGVAAVVGAGLLLTPGLSGHAATGDLVPVAVLSDVVHLSAVSLWLGGLVILAACVLPRRQAAELGAVVPRFSRVAFGAVVTIVVTGVFQAWRQVGSVDALTGTTYGRLLMLKLGVFAGMLGLGFLSRRAVQARYRVLAGRLSPGPGAAVIDPDADAVGRLRRSVGAEAALAAVILSVTSLLVAAEPARSALAQPFSADATTETVLFNVTVDPAKAGPADLHFYTLTPEGQVLDVEELTATLSLPANDLGPLGIDLEKVAPGHWSAYGFQLPLPGAWVLELTARTSEIDQERTEIDIPVR